MSDPLWGDVFSLIHFEGADLSQAINDEKGLSWICDSTCNISTVRAEDGVSSLSIDATSSGRLRSTLPASAWNFLHDRSIDYTLEFSVWGGSLGQDAYLDTGGGTSVQSGILCYSETDGRLHFGIMRGVDSSPALPYFTAPAGSLQPSVWNKVRIVVKKDTGATILVGGTPVASGAFTAAGSQAAAHQTLWVGGSSYLPAGYFTTANFDEFRVSKVALPDTAYTPTVPFPDADSGDGFTPPPRIDTQPMDLRVASGALATFSVVASGTDPLSYQWYENDVLMVGETAATLSFTTDPADHGNWYHCAVSDAGGTTISANANLAIEQGLNITKNPVDVICQQNDPYQFSVQATGVNLTYQWYLAFDDSPIAGATESSYRNTAFQLVNGQGFYCIVTDDNGSQQSTTAYLTVLPALFTTKMYTFYPDGFPCPEIEYGEVVHGFQQATQYDSGWLRLRRNYHDFIRDAQMRFKVNTYEFGVWMEWARNDAYRDWFYIIVDDDIYRTRFASPLSWTYDNYDDITITVRTEVADYDASVSRATPTT